MNAEPYCAFSVCTMDSAAPLSTSPRGWRPEAVGSFSPARAETLACSSASLPLMLLSASQALENFLFRAVVLSSCALVREKERRRRNA